MLDATPQPYRYLDVVYKVTERCNLACPYCYFFFGGDESYLKHSSVTKPETVAGLGRFLAQGARDLRLDGINLIFHGGEPLLMKKARFDAMCEALRREVAPHATLSLALQTNAVLVDDEWIDLFAKHDVGIGVSLDGTKAVHDRNRPDHKGRGSYDATVRGLRRLQAASEAGKLSGVGALCFADLDGDGVATFRHLIEDLGLRSIDFLLPHEGWGGAYGGREAEWRAFFGRLLDYWLDECPHHPRVRLFSGPMMAMISDAGALAHDRHRSNRHNVISITSDGGLGPDDNLRPGAPELADTGMTVFDTTLAGFLSSPFFQAIVAATGSVPARCQGCAWLRPCRSGDLFNRFSRADGFARESAFCAALDAIHERLAAYVMASGVGAEELAGRLGAAYDPAPHDLSRLPLAAPVAASA